MSEATNPCDINIVHKTKWETITFDVFEMGSEEAVCNAFSILSNGGIINPIQEVPWSYSQLSPREQKKLYTMISYQQPMDDDYEQFIKDERFTFGFVCPHCGCIDYITRNGHIIKTEKDGNKTINKQRYFARTVENLLLYHPIQLHQAHARALVFGKHSQNV